MPYMNMRFPTVMILPWRADAAEFWFARLSHLPFAMLLHSGHAVHPYSRFDILVADPVKTLTTDALSPTDDPLMRLQNEIHALGLSATPDPDLPFQGGALGLFGYDLGRRFEKLPEHAQADISLPDMAVGLYDWALIVDHRKQTVSLLSHRDVQARLAWLEAQRPATAEHFMLTSGWHSNMSAAEYAEKFSRVQAYLHSGDCYQVNLAQRFQAAYRGDEWQAFTRLNASNKAPFSAFLRLEHGAILSLSPERFIHLADGIIQTRPIKGTLPRLADANADRQQAETLAASPKDRAENLMIVDLMRNDIRRAGQRARAGAVRCGTFPGGTSSGQYYHCTPAGLADRLRSAPRRVSGRLHHRRAEGPRDGDYRRTGTASPQRLVRQHRLCEPVRNHGYQHHYSHPDGLRR